MPKPATNLIGGFVHASDKKEHVFIKLTLAKWAFSLAIISLCIGYTPSNNQGNSDSQDGDDATDTASGEIHDDTENTDTENDDTEAVVYDMCADSDCDGCCTENIFATGFLIDMEIHTSEQFGKDSGIVEFTCLDCNQIRHDSKLIVLKT